MLAIDFQWLSGSAIGVTGPVGGQPLNKASGLLSTSYANENGNWQPWPVFYGVGSY